MIPLILNEYLVGGFNPTPLKNDGVRQLGYVPNHQPGLSYWLNSKRHAELSNIQSKKGDEMQSKMKLFLPKWQDDQSLQFNDVEPHNPHGSIPRRISPCDRAQHCMARVGRSRCRFSQMPSRTSNEESNMPRWRWDGKGCDHWWTKITFYV